jgi:hypothetical protein
MANAAEVETGEIKKPVTWSALRRVAEAGLPDLLHQVMHLDNPLAMNGARLMATAMRTRAGMLQHQVNVVENLSELSDDSRWRSLFDARADALRQEITELTDEANRRDVAAREFKASGNSTP